ncbi:class I SAM-dependent methyltransferase [Streptomyces sp. NPDC048384]|uniref:class I SAM-dependent methyltransferase n=1 Tax=Streptomyces sp. NPDC048384 TaxID=3155487 RepID=UPI0034463746
MNNNPRGDQYDAADENYVAYWDDRSYEHEAELIAVKRLLGRMHCRNAADIGGGFGRLSLLLQDYADEVFLLDTSQKQLDTAKKFVGASPRIHPQLMRPGAFGLSDSSVDLVTMVRVMHHLPDPTPTLAEISRVLRPSGLAIIEVANLAHGLNRVRYLARGHTVPRGTVDIRSAEKRTEGGIPFVNHHPASIVRQFGEAGLRVERMLSVSNLRHPALKRALPDKSLLAVERALQIPLARLAFGPSMFYLLRSGGLPARR